MGADLANAMKIEKKIPPIDEVEYFSSFMTKWGKQSLREFPWRENNCSTYARILGELLLQRTKAETVAKYYASLMNKYPDWQSLSEAEEASLQKDLKPLGLYKRRAKILKNIGSAVIERGGELPSEREQIEDLPGVGQYIANAIELIVFGRPKPLLDVNMARILERFFGPRVLSDIRHDKYLQKLAHLIVRVSKKNLIVNFAMLDYAALICKPAPDCEDCELSSKCRYFSLTR